MVSTTKAKPELLSQCPKFSREFEIDDDFIDEVMLQTYTKANLYSNLLITL